jgi:AraC family transcriptional regulator
MYDVEIRNLPRRRIIGCAHTGPYPEIGAAYAKVSAVLDDKAFWPKVGNMVGIFYDDPGEVALEQLRSHAGFELAKGARAPKGLETVVLPAARAAVLTLGGPYVGLPTAYHYLYRTWLPALGEVPNDAPSYEVYLNSPMDTASEGLLTEICVPLA